MKKSYQIIAIVLVLAVIFSGVLAVIITGSKAHHTHYVCLEVNPRVEFLTDSKHKVKSLKPLNEEAKILLIDEEFVGLKMDKACDKFLELCLKAGYLKLDGENAVKLTVLSGLNSAMEVRLGQSINKFFVKNNVLGLVIDSSQDMEQFKNAKKAGMTSAKYDLALAVQENNPDLTLQELKKLSPKKLINKIEESHKDYELIYTPEELETKVKLIDFNRTRLNEHLANISAESTREFKEKLIDFKKENSKKYMLNFSSRYEEWLIG